MPGCMMKRGSADDAVTMRIALVLVICLSAFAASVPSVDAIQCAPPNGDPSVVGQVRDHVVIQCQNAVEAVYGGDIVRDGLDVVDYSCTFVTGNTCVP